MREQSGRHRENQGLVWSLGWGLKGVCGSQDNGLRAGPVGWYVWPPGLIDAQPGKLVEVSWAGWSGKSVLQPVYSSYKCASPLSPNDLFGQPNTNVHIADMTPQSALYPRRNLQPTSCRPLLEQVSDPLLPPSLVSQYNRKSTEYHEERGEETSRENQKLL